MQMHSAGPKEAWLGSSILSTPFYPLVSTQHLTHTEQRASRAIFKTLERRGLRRIALANVFDIVVMDSTLWGLEVSPQKDVLGGFPESWQEVARARLPL